MNTSPRNIRLSENALKALKVLEQAHPSGKRCEAVSDALVAAANGIAALPVIRLSPLDPEAILTLRAELAETARQYQTIRKDIFKIRPQDKNSAEKIAKVCSRCQESLDKLDAISSRISETSRLTTQVGPHEATYFRTLISWAQARSEATETKPEHRPIYALWAKLLRALFQ